MPSSLDAQQSQRAARTAAVTVCGCRQQITEVCSLRKLNIWHKMDDRVCDGKCIAFFCFRWNGGENLAEHLIIITSNKLLFLDMGLFYMFCFLLQHRHFSLFTRFFFFILKLVIFESVFSVHSPETAVNQTVLAGQEEGEEWREQAENWKCNGFFFFCVFVKYFFSLFSYNKKICHIWLCQCQNCT